MCDTVALNRFQETIDYTVDNYSDIDNSEKKSCFVHSKLQYFAEILAYFCHVIEQFLPHTIAVGKKTGDLVGLDYKLHFSDTRKYTRKF
jgi:hypothetical protein